METLLQLSGRYRPREGWLSFLLLLLVIALLNVAVLDVGWVPEDTVLLPATVIGLLLGMTLAKRTTPAWMAWALLSAYGLLIVTLTLGRLWPPLNLLLRDWPALRRYWLENGTLFAERVTSWITAVSLGGRSNETIVFALLMGLLAWFLAAYLAWSAYRQRQPLLGLTLMGLLVALNGYYGAAPIEWAAMFVGTAVVATAVFHFARLEWGWEDRQVDYSTQIRFDILVYAVGLGVALLALSFLLPSLSLTGLARSVLGSETVSGIEETLDRAFGGIESERSTVAAPGSAGGTGTMPRAFLIGNAPELSRIVMMTATVEVTEGQPAAYAGLVRHWRGLSYAVYTGRGWALSPEQETPYEPWQPLPLPPAQEQMRIRQQVHWRYDNRATRYSLGLPVVLDQAVTAHYRDRTDLVRVSGAGPTRYEVISRLAAASPEQLRLAFSGQVPAAIQSRYTQLPDSVPERVRDLAQEVAAGQQTAYDQALALEQFLRQYDYSLDVPLPPPGVDVVDFFLFDLQKGYCDYYASAMVVMARSLGLSARLATGFLAQTPDAGGVQTIYEIDSHAWAEVYLAGYGWVEFEPTAAFISPQDPRGLQPAMEIPESAPPVPIPEAEPTPEAPVWPWIVGGLVAVTAVLGLFLRQRQQQPYQDLDEVQAAFSHLQAEARRLGHPLPPGQTPYEFDSELQARLEELARQPRLAGWIKEVQDPSRQLTDLFVRHQYSEHPPDDALRARNLWQRIRRPLRLLWLGALVAPPDTRKGENG